MSLDNWTAIFSFSLVRHNVICKTVMRGSRNFRQGGGGGRSALTTFFCFSPQLILQKSNGQFKKKIYNFSRFQRGSNIVEGGQLFPGGSNCLLSIETHITCDFSGGGGVPTPVPPPSGSALDSNWICCCFFLVVHAYFSGRPELMTFGGFIWIVSVYCKLWKIQISSEPVY